MSASEASDTCVFCVDPLQRDIIVGNTRIQLSCSFHQRIVILKCLVDLCKFDAATAPNDPFGRSAIRPDFFHALLIIAARILL